jgi:RimJ/RimL family protein N-acetyltransferase
VSFVLPARYPARVTLDGRYTRLEPLDAEAHAEALFEITSGRENDDLWLYLADGPFESADAFRDEIARKAGSAEAVFFAILDAARRRPMGYASYMRIEPGHGVIEVGNVLFSHPLQGTTGATEAMYLMARHAFEDLGYRRYEWKCNALNAPSRAAALRLGFTFEGIFRQHMVIKAQNRDTAWFSMIDGEWPRLRTAFDRWLDPSNFDAQGRQRATLRSFRE